MIGVIQNKGLICPIVLCDVCHAPIRNNEEGLAAVLKQCFASEAQYDADHG